MPLPDETLHLDLKKAIEFLMEFMTQKNWNPVLHFNDRTYRSVTDLEEILPVSHGFNSEGHLGTAAGTSSAILQGPPLVRPSNT